MTVKKIKNLKTTPTEEKLFNSWNEIKSFKNRLLQNSDWINMPDNELEDSIVRLWVEWRKKVRRVVEFDIKDTDGAYLYLMDLQNNQPPVKYKNSDYQSIEYYKTDLKKLLFSVLKKSVDDMYKETESRELILERFDEATRFLDGKTENNFLIDIESEYSGLSKESIAKKFIDDRKNYLIKLITIEKIKKKYIKMVDDVDNFEDCDRIKHELLTLGTKKWI